MRPRYLGMLVAAILAVSACGGAASGPTTTPATAPSSTGSGSTTSSAPSGDTVEISIGTDIGAELKFDPAELTIQAGTTVRVTFENQSSVPHNLTFPAPINVATATVVEPGSSEAVEFKEPDPGQYAFVCTLHPGMGGTLVVEAG